MAILATEYNFYASAHFTSETQCDATRLGISLGLSCERSQYNCSASSSASSQKRAKKPVFSCNCFAYEKFFFCTTVSLFTRDSYAKRFLATVEAYVCVSVCHTIKPYQVGTTNSSLWRSLVFCDKDAHSCRWMKEFS